MLFFALIQSARIPPNCSFEVDDFESNWVYSRHFDYVHGRELAGSVENFDRLFTQAYNNLKPGGYLEMQSFRIELFSENNNLEKLDKYTEWIQLLHEASARFGKVMTNMDDWPNMMSNAGFRDIKIDIIKVPMSPWPNGQTQKEIGEFMEIELRQALHSYTLALFCRVLDWRKKNVDALLASVKAELKDCSLKLYSKLYIVYGRKP